MTMFTHLLAATFLATPGFAAGAPLDRPTIGVEPPGFVMKADKPAYDQPARGPAAAGVETKPDSRAKADTKPPSK